MSHMMDLQQYHLPEQQSIDYMNGFIQLDQSPSILAFQVPGSCAPLTSNQAGPGLTGKYVHLLNVIEELGKDIRPTYAGSKTSIERLKRNIIQARFEIRQCLIELERTN